ncbi:MAG: ATP synthase F1 subunit gamma [Candidatus Eremiobacteraeota bacterium]|nr:ATP synthase F1 subunit gamma [Candidatus Eremiobacteraeota bacterium]MBV8353812.1 ATP synthase F1 subunit gamma [Candidatus Eremiobacteraeota bacterium]
MPTVRQLRDRIKSLKNTQQITKAMKQVAAAKIRRAEMLQSQSRPYAQTIDEMLRDLIEAVGSVDHPYLRPGAAGKPAGVILMTADKGLAGAFNSNAVRAAEEYRRGEPNGVLWYVVGIKGRNAMRRSGEIAHFWPQSSGQRIEVAREVARRAGEDFAAGTISKITLVSQRLVSLLVQRPETRELIPIVREERAKTAPASAVEFEPDAESVLSRLLPKYLEFTIFSALLETDAAFFAAQLLAMTNATDNAGKLIDELTLDMNKARQAAITKEILEIVGGAEALSG